MTELQDPTAPDRVRLGVLIRDLRQAANLTRKQLGDLINLGVADMRGVEIGRFRLSQARWDRLIAALPDLAVQVAAQGIQVHLAEPKPA